MKLNRGGRKQPFTRADVATIRSRLAHATRDLAMFEVAVSSMLRASDVVPLRVSDVTDPKSGEVAEVSTVRQQKTQREVQVVLSDAARAAVGRHIAANGLTGDDHLFTRSDNAKSGKRAGPGHLSVRAFELNVKAWASLAGYRDVRRFSGHTTRRTKATIAYSETHDLEGVRQALGHTSLAHTACYIATEGRGLALSRAVEV